MGKSDSNKVKTTFSRNMLHGNSLNKKGLSAEYYKNAASRKMPDRACKNRASSGSSGAHHQLGDVVVKAHAPKVENGRTKSDEVRYTIPNSPVNTNIFNQGLVRADVVHSLIMNEVKEKVPCPV